MQLSQLLGVIIFLAVRLFSVEAASGVMHLGKAQHLSTKQSDTPTGTHIDRSDLGEEVEEESDDDHTESLFLKSTFSVLSPVCSLGQSSRFSSTYFSDKRGGTPLFVLFRNLRL